LNGLSDEEFLLRVSENFSLEKCSEPVMPGERRTFGMYLNKQWYRLGAYTQTNNTDTVSNLDISILQNNLLAPVLGIQDQRTDKRIDFVGGIRGLAELEKKVDSKEMSVAFSLYPVDIDDLFSVADSGNVMPPKSTWFEPKLRDGLLTHVLD
jgi:uncharacterized protein (DUF1015 family)